MAVELTIIAAVADLEGSRIIGSKGKMPWNLPEDLKRFRDLTINHPVIMGRVTYEAILERLGRPLDKRINIVISGMGIENPDENITVCPCIYPDALTEAEKYGPKAYVIGGGRIYSQVMSLPHTTRLEITEVKGDYHGDCFFPHIHQDMWRLTQKAEKERCNFLTYERIK